MNIAGVVKDWLLIGLSVLLYRSPISRVNLGGYSIAFVSVCFSMRLCTLSCSVSVSAAKIATQRPQK